jgi:hypothetical protein
MKNFLINTNFNLKKFFKIYIEKRTYEFHSYSKLFKLIKIYFRNHKINIFLNIKPKDNKLEMHLKKEYSKLNYFSVKTLSSIEVEKIIKENNIKVLDHLNINIENNPLESFKELMNVIDRSKFITFNFSKKNLETDTNFSSIYNFFDDREYQLFIISSKKLISVRKYKEIYENINEIPLALIKRSNLIKIKDPVRGTEEFLFKYIY